MSVILSEENFFPPRKEKLHGGEILQVHVGHGYPNLRRIIG